MRNHIARLLFKLASLVAGVRLSYDPRIDVLDFEGQKFSGNLLRSFLEETPAGCAIRIEWYKGARRLRTIWGGLMDRNFEPLWAMDRDEADRKARSCRELPFPATCEYAEDRR